jgi:hypothetical protein
LKERRCPLFFNAWREAVSPETSRRVTVRKILLRRHQ